MLTLGEGPGRLGAPQRRVRPRWSTFAFTDRKKHKKSLVSLTLSLSTPVCLSVCWGPGGCGPNRGAGGRGLDPGALGALGLLGASSSVVWLRERQDGGGVC